MAVDLKGKIALITGASRGLGEAIAHDFWSRGANLILVARRHRDDPSLEIVYKELAARAKTNQWCRTIGVDLGSATGVDKLMRSVDDVDTLVNNAAILGPVGNLEDNDLMEWTDCLRVNLLAPVALCKACIPLMKTHNRGKIINIAGGGATSPRPQYTAYASAKTALVRFSETLAAELEDANIDVNCVSPGLLPTRLSSFQGEPDAMSKAIKLISFLAGRESDGITGRILSAQYDSWEKIPDAWPDIRWSDKFTLRRIISPKGHGHV